MVAANTPASRVRLERFGKSSIALARCTGSENGPPPDQSAYEPLFRSASEVLANYRSLLGVRHTVPGELAQIPGQKEATNPKIRKAEREPGRGKEMIKGFPVHPVSSVFKICFSALSSAPCIEI